MEETASVRQEEDQNAIHAINALIERRQVSHLEFTVTQNASRSMKKDGRGRDEQRKMTNSRSRSHKMNLSNSSTRLLNKMITPEEQYAPVKINTFRNQIDKFLQTAKNNDRPQTVIKEEESHSF